MTMLYHSDNKTINTIWLWPCPAVNPKPITSTRPHITEGWGDHRTHHCSSRENNTELEPANTDRYRWGMLLQNGPDLWLLGLLPCCCLLIYQLVQQYSHMIILLYKARLALPPSGGMGWRHVYNLVPIRAQAGDIKSYKMSHLFVLCLMCHLPISSMGSHWLYRPNVSFLFILNGLRN